MMAAEECGCHWHTFYSHVGNYLFPAWEFFVPRQGTCVVNNKNGGRLTTLPVSMKNYLLESHSTFSLPRQCSSMLVIALLAYGKRSKY